jgi:hypothetical protein
MVRDSLSTANAEFLKLQRTASNINSIKMAA